MPHTREITYTDELLADGTVHRRYSHGRQEWRSRPRGTDPVSWRDDEGGSGTDEPLGRRIVKRTYGDGRVLYGRDCGFGRTLWGDGVLTVNRTVFPGRTGAALLAAVAVGVPVGGWLAPPDSLSPEEEAELRREAEAQAAGGGGGGGESGGYGEWGGDGGADDGDFG